MCKAKNGLLGQGSNLEQFFDWFLWTMGIKTLDKLTDQPGKLIPLDRGGSARSFGEWR
jgi:hypothetical protein